MGCCLFLNMSHQTILVPRVLDSFQDSWIGVESALKYKVVTGSARLTMNYLLGMNLNKKPEFPTYPFQAMYEGESGTKATIDSNFMVLLAFARYAAKVDRTELLKVLASNSNGLPVSEKLRLVLGYYAEPRHWKCLNQKFFVQQGNYQEWKDSLRQIGVSSFTNLGIIEVMEMLLQNDVLVDALEGAKLYSPRFGVETLSQVNVAAMNLALLRWKRDIVDEFLLPIGLLQEVESVPYISHIDAHLIWFRIAKEPEFQNTINFANFVQHFVVRDKDGNIINVSGTADECHWPREEVAKCKKTIGLADYHGTMSWTWLLGCFIGLAHQRGDIQLRDELLNWCLSTQTQIKSSGFSEYISEIYLSGTIMHSALYTSETPFMWGSSYILWATSNILRDAGEAT